MALSALVALALAVLSTMVAVNQPWLGLTLAGNEEGPGLRVAAVDRDGPSASMPDGAVVTQITDGQGRVMTLEPFDMAEEPDAVSTYVALDRFFDRQGDIARILSSGAVRFTLQNGPSVTVIPEPARPLGTLQLGYWIQIASAFAALLIGVSVWMLKPGMAAGRILAAAGVALVLSSYPSAIYMARELALPGDLFRLLNTINPFGSFAFVLTLLLLFLTYPKRLVPVWGLAVIGGVVGLWWLVDTLRVDFIPGPHISRYLPTALLTLGALFAAAVQYWQAAGAPQMRAALRWFGLSLAVALGLFVLIFVAPIVMGAPAPVPQGVAYALGVIVYGGMALCIVRYRLFDLDRWTFRILLYAGAALILVSVDVFLVAVLSLQYQPAFGLAVLVMVLLYLPLRSWLTSKLMPSAARDHQSFKKVVDVALAPRLEDRDVRWQALLREAFSPLSIVPSQEPAAVHIEDEGLVLAVPGRGAVTPLTLHYAHGGKKLFSSRDSDHLGELCDMLAYSYETRAAHEQGIAEERARISRDTHDNIGAKLLSALHGHEPARKDMMIREALADLRDIVNASIGESRTLEEILAELRLETAERLSAAGLRLDWTVRGDPPADLPADVSHAIRSIVREAISNIIRHAHASTAQVVIVCDTHEMRVDIRDDGRGFEASDMDRGFGLKGMKARVTDLDGRFSLIPSPSGTLIEAWLPIGDHVAESPVRVVG